MELSGVYDKRGNLQCFKRDNIHNITITTMRRHQGLSVDLVAYFQDIRY